MLTLSRLPSLSRVGRAIAANTLAATLEGFESNAPVGVGLAMMTIVGQCVGAGRFPEAKKHLKTTGGNSATTRFIRFSFFVEVASSNPQIVK